jgi:hypothetical protein
VKSSDIAASLARLTAGWAPGPNQNQRSLFTARRALASSLALGIDSSASHPVLPTSAPETNTNIDLTDLIGAGIDLSSATTFGLISNVAAIDASNPSGLPAAARGMKVQESNGLFFDSNGVAFQVHILPRVREASVAFGTAH